MKKGLKALYLSLIYLFLYAPIIVLIIFSFNEGRSRSAWEGFSLKWYGELLHNSAIMDALKTTLLIAVLSALISTVVGTAAAFAIHHTKKLPKTVLMNITNLPVLNPDIVTGIALMMFFAFIKIPFGHVSMLLAHISFNVPYVIISVLPKFRQMNNNLLEAALDLGATPVYAYRKILLPEIMPGVITGFLMAFTLSIDDFVISYFTSGSVSNLAMYIYAATSKRFDPSINALATLMFMTIFGLLFLVNFRSRDKSQKNAR